MSCLLPLMEVTLKTFILTLMIKFKNKALLKVTHSLLKPYGSTGIKMDDSSQEWFCPPER